MNTKRMFREFKANLLKNISFVLLIVLSVMIIVGFNRAMDSYIAAVDRFHETHHVEDGQFRIMGSLTKKQRMSMERRFNLVIEENKNIDYELDSTQKAKKASKKERIIRIICADKEINQLAVMEGRRFDSNTEVVLDPTFAKAHHYAIGDEITLRDNTFTIVGYGISPDYVNALKNSSDFLSSPETFGIAYLSKEGFEKVDTNEVKSTLYSYQSKGGSTDRLKDYLNDYTALLEFLEKDDNSRIKAVYDDANGPKQMSLVIGVLLIMIVSFIISISIQNTLKAESQTIGILYAQGINRKELLSYYLLLPTLLVLVGSLLGYAGGVIVSKPILLIEDVQYTVPNVTLKDSWYLIVVGILLPIALTIVITRFFLLKALSKTPLSLLSGNHSAKKVSKLEKAIKFKGANFFTRFRLKDMLRERGSMIALLFGVLLSMMVLSTSAYVRDSCNKFIDNLNTNVPFNYAYTFIDSKDLNKYRKQGELSVLKSIKVDLKEGQKSFLIQGIRPDSTIYNIPGIEELGTGEILIPPSILVKFKLHIGDSLTLVDDIENKTYQVVIKGISNYDYGQYLFTNIQTFNQLFDIHKESYNTLVTHKSIDIPEEKVSSLINKKEMISGIRNLLNMINVMSSIMLIASIFIFIIVIYMLMNMIIEKAKVNISMVKIFGYTPDEVTKLYLRGTLVILIIGFIGGVPLGYRITKMLYDSIMMNMQQYVLPYIKPASILMSFIIMLLSYALTCHLLRKKLDEVPLTEALKNRE